MNLIPDVSGGIIGIMSPAQCAALPRKRSYVTLYYRDLLYILLWLCTSISDGILFFIVPFLCASVVSTAASRLLHIALSRHLLVRLHYYKARLERWILV